MRRGKVHQLRRPGEEIPEVTEANASSVLRGGTI
jgi:hypothetical protein